MGALARRATGAVCHRDEVGGKRRQAADRVPQGRLHLGRLRREELERDADAVGVADEAARARALAHHATSRFAEVASARRGSRASHSETAILPSEWGSGGKLWCETTSRPAAAIHCVMVSGAKP